MDAGTVAARHITVEDSQVSDGRLSHALARQHRVESARDLRLIGTRARQGNTGPESDSPCEHARGDEDGIALGGGVYGGLDGGGGGFPGGVWGGVRTTVRDVACVSRAVLQKKAQERQNRGKNAEDSADAHVEFLQFALLFLRKRFIDREGFPISLTLVWTMRCRDSR